MSHLWTIRVTPDTTFDVPGQTSLLDEAREAGNILEYSCRNGRCGVCRAKLLSGEVRLLRPDLSLTAAEADDGWFLTCCNAAATDCVVQAHLLNELRDVEVKTLPCRIDTIERLAPDVVRVMLRLPPRSNFVSVAGQYIDVIGRNGLRRSYSLANARNADDRIELHIREVADGAMSAYWFGSAKVNDLLRLEGPFGTFIFRQPERCVGREIAMLATGTGFAPIKAMLEQLAGYDDFFTRNRVTVIWGGREPEDIYCSLEGLGPVAFEAVLSAGQPAGAKRYVQHALHDRVRDLGSLSVFACGSDAMIRSARDFLISEGLPPDRYHYESFVSSETSAAGST